MRERAADEVREHVGRVAEATSAMLARLEGMESELAGLLEAVRGGAGRLDAGLRELGAELEQAGQVATPAPRAEFHPDAPPVEVPEESSWAPDSEPGSGDAPHESGPESSGAVPSWDTAPSSSGWDIADGQLEEPAPVESGSESFPDSPSAPPGAPAPVSSGEASSGWSDSSGESVAGTGAPPESAGQGESDDDSEGARLIALNMALNGTPREETARYLSENFQLRDRNRLLDEVYASVEG